MHRKVNEPIHVTRAMVPDEERYMAGLRQIFASHHFTNHGPFESQLESELGQRLGVANLTLCSNGTTALLLSLRCANLAQRQVITTPFTYVATLSSILWEHCLPVFCDIDEETLCLDPALLPGLHCDSPGAIIPVHVYGNACDIDAIESFASDHSLTTIYDAAQAFGSTYKGKSLLGFGDFSVCSFHSTKVFHAVEGGCVVTRSSENNLAVRLMSAFGHVGDDHYTLGVNAKMSELHALMGLVLLDQFESNIAQRKIVSELYDSLLPKALRKPTLNPHATYNYSYYPVIFESEETLLKVLTTLNANNIFPRRYFFPSLTELPYIKSSTPCPVAERVAKRVLCLPLYAELADEHVEFIMKTISRLL